MSLSNAKTPRGQISPPAKVAELEILLGANYPNADPIILHSVAANIDRQIRSLVQSQLSIKISRKPRYWPKQFVKRRPHNVSWTLTRGCSLADSLHRLLRAARSKNSWQWSKAWQELPAEALSFLESIDGPEAVWGKVPLSLPIDPRWRQSFARVGASVLPNEPSSPDTIFALNIAGAPIPHPSSVLPLITKAIRLTVSGRPQNFRRDIHLAAIVRAYERLTGTSVTMPSHTAGSSRRRAPIVDFLATIEDFYSAEYPKPFGPLHFDVQNSGHAWARIFCALGRT